MRAVGRAARMIVVVTVETVQTGFAAGPLISAVTAPVTRLLLLGTLPGVVAGAVIRVFAVPGPRVFRLVVAAVLLPLGLWLYLRAVRPARAAAPLSRRATVMLALGVGTVGGVYGIGGGSLIGPALAGRGTPMSQVAPAALAATFVTSIAGAATYAALAPAAGGDIAPDWLLGLACGLGGLAGGYLGARLQPRLPETGLRLLLGALAAALAVLYLVEALRP